MLEFRLKALEIYESKPMPKWGGDLSTLEATIRPPERGGFSIQNRRHVPVEFGEIRFIHNRPVFDRLDHPLSPLRPRERCHDVRIRDNEIGGVKRSDQILSGLDVHSGLSADRGIDHRHQTSWNLHERDASHVRRRDEATEVTRYASTHRDQA